MATIKLHPDETSDIMHPAAGYFYIETTEDSPEFAMLKAVCRAVSSEVVFQDGQVIIGRNYPEILALHACGFDWSPDAAQYAISNLVSTIKGATTTKLDTHA